MSNNKGDKKTNILGVITARGGSKGIPHKNIKLLGGKPLIFYTIDVAKRSQSVTDLIVSTDDKKIAAVAGQYNCSVPFLRPKELAKDTTLHLPILQHALQYMEKDSGTHYDAIVNLQPTSPFRLPEDIDKTVEKLFQTNADSAVSVCEVNPKYHPIKMKKLEGDFIVPYILEEPEGIRRQDIPTVYQRSGAVYVTRRHILMDENKFYGDKVAAHQVDSERSVDLDVPQDWIVAEWKLENLKKRGFFKYDSNEI